MSDRLLTEKEIFALLASEESAQSYAKVDLPAAQQELQQAKSQMEAAERKLHNIEGAIQGAQIMIFRYLEKAGVSYEDYQAQRGEYLQSALEAQQTASGIITPDDVIGKTPEHMQSQMPAELVKDDEKDPDEVKVVKPPNAKSYKHRGQ